MTFYTERFYTSADGLKLYYRDYDRADGADSGIGDQVPVLCIPALTCNARDFEFIAEHMAAARRVLVADLRGRGRSAYDPEWHHYTAAIEAADMMRLLEDAKCPEAIVLGTSRGGIVAMAMATARPAVLAGVILNDMGAEIEISGLTRIRDSLDHEDTIADWKEAVDVLKAAYAPMFAEVSDEQWLALAQALYHEENGAITPDYDPNLGKAMQAGIASRRTRGKNIDLWQEFMALKDIPTLLLRGENSDVLSVETVAAMIAAKPDLVAVTVEDRGHVPFLDEADAVEAIDSFLEGIHTP